MDPLCNVLVRKNFADVVKMLVVYFKISIKINEIESPVMPYTLERIRIPVSTAFTLETQCQDKQRLEVISQYVTQPRLKSTRFQAVTRTMVHNTSSQTLKDIYAHCSIYIHPTHAKKKLY